MFQTLIKMSAFIRILNCKRHLSSSFHFYRFCSSNSTQSGVPHKSLRSQDIISPAAVPASADVVIIGKSRSE